MSDKSTETTIHGGNPDNGCPPGGSDRGIVDSMATAGLQLGYRGVQSLATGSGGNGLGPQPPLNPKQNPIGAVTHLASSMEAATSVVLTINNRVLDTWKHIQEAEAKEDVLLGKIQENLDKMDAVINPARNIQKCVKENLQKVMSLMRRITSSKKATGKIKSSFELILLTDSDRRLQCSEVSVHQN